DSIRRNCFSLWRHDGRECIETATACQALNVGCERQLKCQLEKVEIFHAVYIAILPTRARTRWSCLGFKSFNRQPILQSVQGSKADSQALRPFKWFDRSRSLTAGFLDGLQFRARSRNHHDRPALPLIPS